MTTNHARESHLFTLRLWAEEDEQGGTLWRGKLCHVMSDQTRHFRDWPALIPLLLSMLPKDEPSSPPVETESG